MQLTKDNTKEPKKDDMEDITQSERHQAKAVNGVEAAIPAIQHAMQPAKGLKKLLQVAALIAMSFLGIMAMGALSPPEQHEQVTLQKKPFEEIRPSKTPGKAPPQIHTTAIPAIEKCATQRPFWTIKHIIGAVVILIVGVSIALWRHYNTTNFEVCYVRKTKNFYDYDINNFKACYVQKTKSRKINIEQLKQNATWGAYNKIQLLRLKKDVLSKLLFLFPVSGIRSYIDRQAIIAQTNIVAEQEAADTEEAQEEAKKLIESYWDHYFDYLALLHYREAIKEIGTMLLVGNEKSEGMRYAVEAFTYNKWVSVMVTYGWWREQEDTPEIGHDIIHIIAQYGYKYAEKLRYKEMNDFIENVASKEYDSHLIYRSTVEKWINAAKSGNTEDLKTLYNQHGDNIMVCSDKEKHRTALLWSACNGHLACVKYLVEQGANIHATDSDGQIALMLIAAYKKEHLDCVDYLLKKGADINAQDKWGKTALMLRAEQGPLAFVKHLVKKGAKIEAQDEYGNTALIWSAKSCHKACVKYLVKQGADINARGSNGYTALIWSAEKGEVDSLKYLHKQGANIHAKTKYGGTALIRSAKQRHFACVKYLVEQGAEINAKNRWDETALMWCAGAGDLGCVRDLLQHGADINAKDKDEWTALMWSEYNDFVDCVNYLRQQGAI